MDKKLKVVKSEIMTAKVEDYTNSRGEKRSKHVVFGKIYTNEDGSKWGKLKSTPLGKDWDGSFFIGIDKLWRGDLNN